MVATRTLDEKVATCAHNCYAPLPTCRNCRGIVFVREQGKSKLLSECQSLVNHNILTKQTFLGAMLLNESILRSISRLALHKQSNSGLYIRHLH
jgi:hypothetical protein